MAEAPNEEAGGACKRAPGFPQGGKQHDEYGLEKRDPVEPWPKQVRCSSVPAWAPVPPMTVMMSSRRQTGAQLRANDITAVRITTMTRLNSGTECLARLLRAHDRATANHSLRVRDLSLRLGQVLQMSPLQRLQLRMAAEMHDVGKIAVPRLILRKEGPLSPKEQKQMQEHPSTGERLLRSSFASSAVLAAVRGHHERYDGGGYPDGLKGRGIPQLARVLAIADVFDAITSPRPYRRKPMPREDALGYLRARGQPIRPRASASLRGTPDSALRGNGTDLRQDRRK